MDIEVVDLSEDDPVAQVAAEEELRRQIQLRQDEELAKRLQSQMDSVHIHDPSSSGIAVSRARQMAPEWGDDDRDDAVAAMDDDLDDDLAIALAAGPSPPRPTRRSGSGSRGSVRSHSAHSRASSARSDRSHGSSGSAARMSPPVAIDELLARQLQEEEQKAQAAARSRNASDMSRVVFRMGPGGVEMSRSSSAHGNAPNPSDLIRAHLHDLLLSGMLQAGSPAAAAQFGGAPDIDRMSYDVCLHFYSVRMKKIDLTPVSDNLRRIFLHFKSALAL